MCIGSGSVHVVECKKCWLENHLAMEDCELEFLFYHLVSVKNEKVEVDDH